MKGALALLLAALVLGAGCRSLTGQSAGEWMGDRTITAKVKTRLATGGKGLTLMRVHVDTYDDTVYLTGAVETPALKERAEAIAREVRGVRLVVNNIHVPRGETNGQGHEAASPATEAAVASDRDVPRALARGKRLARLDPETGTPGWTRYAGYDHAGRRIATVYAVTADELARRGITGLAGEHLSIEQVGVYPDGERYYIVLWHVNAEESARLH